MGNRAALLAVIIVGACGGGSGAAKKTTTTAPEPTTGSAKKPPPEPPRPQPQPVDVATLEVWEGNVDDGPVKVAAADVDGEVLRRVLVPSAIEIISVRADGLVTGRVSGSRVGVLSALTGVNPALKLGPRAKLSGKGPGMIIDAIGIDSRQLFQSFADGLGTSVVVLAPPQKLTVSATAGSIQRLMDEVAKAAGLVIEKPAANLVVVRARSQPKVGKLPAKGAKIDLDVRGAAPGHVLGLIATATGAAAPSGTCTAGEATTLRVKGLPSGAVAKLVEKTGGEIRVTACALETASGGDLGKLTLVASATAGGKTLWLAMDGDRAVLVDGEVPGWPAGADDADPAAGDDPLAGARLAATIEGVGNGVAIVEVAGKFDAVEPLAADETGVAGVVKVAAGEVEVVDAKGAKRTLKLSTRPAAK